MAAVESRSKIKGPRKRVPRASREVLVARSRAGRVLVPVDGSEGSHRAVEHVVRSFDPTRPFEVRLLNVQTPIPLRKSWRLDRKAILRQQQQDGRKALRIARARLDEAGIPYEYYVAVGPVAQTIVGYAKRWHCDSILLGTRGLGVTPGLLLGSVALKVVHLAETPVTLMN
jgi:nucleotide-binding universal stress UspA family protein